MGNREELVVNQLTTQEGKSVTFGAAAPTVGAHKVGEIVFNTAPSAAGVFAWACTTAGTPGTWKTVALAA